MSRIGKLPITIPGGVKIDIQGSKVQISGPKGALTRELNPGISVKLQDSALQVECDKPNDRVQRALWGLSRSLLLNMVLGVTQGFRKDLEVLGVGYRAELKGEELVLSLGFSHPVHMPVPQGVKISVEKNNLIRVEGIDKELVGQVAADIRRIKVPDPYKVKGIKYVDEQIRHKVGKAGA